ncbi:MAG: hypothetical protein QOH68_1432, partial [Nocardioidaceae bacterium]|nr:hypothetical protein [Nocardioidaceae bacterium]
MAVRRGDRVRKLDIEAILDQVPALAGFPRTVEELSGGLTNQNLKVVIPGGAYVV